MLERWRLGLEAIGVRSSVEAPGELLHIFWISY